MRIYVLVTLIAAAVAFLSTPMARVLAVKVNAVTAVRSRDVHTIPTPRLGGVAMWLAMAVMMMFASQMPFFHPLFLSATPGMLALPWAILGSAGLICLLGVADDIWDLDWITKLIGQVLAAGFMAWQGVQLVTFPIFGLTIGTSRLSIGATIAAVVLIVNAVNWVDGLDGLAAGLVAIGGSAYVLYTYILARDSDPADFASLSGLVMCGVVGACVGFLPFNFNPAKIFMGDSGAMLLGLSVAASVIVVTGQIDPQTVSAREGLPAFLPLLVPVAILVLPILDVLITVTRRILRGQSPFHADRNHLHHRLLALGHSHRGAVLVLYVWAFVGSYCALGFAFVQVPVMIGVTVVAVVVAAYLTWWIPRRLRERRVGSAASAPQPPAEPASSTARSESQS